MKKILITGANSFIGTSFENFIERNFSGGYLVDTVDMVDGRWREKSFSGYDAIFHVAGIAHIKETKKNAHLYYEINRDLAVEVAKKAKAEGVRQFVFLSSMNVYGTDVGVITPDTQPAPKSNYGRSKLEAETLIGELSSENFKVCILRPPMVYGPGCKGNYQTLVKIVEKSFVFPRISNKRSLITIDNLVSFVKFSVDKELSGLYFPQNKDYVNTMDLAKKIAEDKNKKIYFSYVLGWGVFLLRPFFGVLKKAFGNLTYKDTEKFDYCYCITENGKTGE